MKQFFALLLWVSGFAFAANEMCLDFCSQCKGSKDATCAKVFETCKCKELFQKAEADAKAKVERDKARKLALGDSLRKECAAGRCVSRIWFEGSELKKLQALEAGSSKPAPEPKVKPLEGECTDLCKLTATGKPDNPMIVKIEETCGCSKYVQDSLAREAFRAERALGTASALDSIVAFCTEDEICKLQVTLDGTTFGISKLVKLDAPKEAPQAKPAVSYKEARRQALGDSLYQKCLKGKCVSRVWFEGARLKKFEAQESKNFTPAKEPSLKPLGSECAELCQGVSDAADNPMAQKIETTCGCSAHAQDSLKLEAFRQTRLRGAAAAADSVVAFCKNGEVCKVQVSLDGTTFGVAELKNLEEKKQGGTASSSSSSGSSSTKKSTSSSKYPLSFPR